MAHAWERKALRNSGQSGCEAHFYGSFENEALENEDQSTKHPNLENESPKNLKTKTPKLETGLSFINTRQCLANTAGIKHDNE